ncbi:hypothetical protein XENOCAPTIV_010764 [Xenoophorus captivus]|uniref:Transposable element P transposase n=1 Tax=Xenoophorus captivus TaxID=1517983 RepID=A0ABV0RY25_9TELE
MKAIGMKLGHKKTFVEHPVRPDKRLYFMPDVPHLVKNLKSALVSGQTFTIPPEIVQKKTVKSGSYQEDGGSLQAEFLDIKETFLSPGLRVKQLIGNTDIPDLTNSETCILYHLTGYIVYKAIKHSNICDGCSRSIKQNDDTLEGEHSTLLILKEFKPGVLCRASHEAFSLVQKVEKQGPVNLSWSSQMPWIL